MIFSEVFALFSFQSVGQYLGSYQTTVLKQKFKKAACEEGMDETPPRSEKKRIALQDMIPLQVSLMRWFKYLQ
jgi:hypothetical protein